MPLALGVLSMVAISLRRSRNRSALASGRLATEYSTPSCSPKNRRSVPGQRAISVGWFAFTLGKARTDLNGGGGSGEPVTFEVVHGLRTSTAFAASFFG